MLRNTTEHLALPTECKAGVIATKIGAHVGDIAKGADDASQNLQMAHARKELNWEEQYKYAMYPHRCKSNQR